MTINDIYSQLYSFRLADLIPLTDIQTEEDKKAQRNIAYIISYTEDEWKAKYPEVDARYVYYAPLLASTPMVYFDEEKIIWLNIPIIPGMQSEAEKNFPENFVRAIHKCEELAEKGKRGQLLYYMPSGICMEVIAMLLDREGPSSEVYEYFKDYYPACDCFTSMFPDDFAERLAKCKSEEQKKETAEKLARFVGNEIPVYRGCADGSAPPNKALSWTEDISIAYLFALKAGDNPKILRGTVNKKDVLEYFDGTEKEVVVLPNSVHIESEEAMYSVNDDHLVEFANNFHPLYCVARERIKELYADGQSDHDAMHTLRVLFLALMLGSLEGVSNAKLRQLAMAAVYHDVGRENDDDDNGHGARSAELYEGDFEKRADPTVIYLIRNHCTPDEQGMEQASSKQEKKLLAILKDADALDRLRFGYPNSRPDALDISQLRLKESLKLINVAKNALNALEL